MQSGDDGEISDPDEDAYDEASNSDGEERDDLPMRLRWAQERGRQAVRQDRLGHRVALLPAARQLEQALTFFMHDEQVWDRLRRAERRMGDTNHRDLLRLTEIQDQDLSALLVYLGYRPPPPSETLQRDLRDALEDAIADGGSSAGRAARTRRAHDEMFFFVYRLRGLIKAAAQIQDSPTDAAVSPTRQERVWRGLRAGVQKGVVIAGPAAVAVGATTMLFPPTAPATAAVGLVMAGTAAMQEAVKTYLQFGTTVALDRILADEPGRADPMSLFSVATLRVKRAILEAASTARTAGGSGAEPGAELVPAELELTSSELALRIAALDVDVPPNRFAELTTSIAASTVRLRRLAKKQRLSPSIKEQLRGEAEYLESLVPQLDGISATVAGD